MKPGLLLLGMVIAVFSTAQLPGIQLFENSNAGMISTRSTPRLIGKVGENYLMMDNSAKGIILTVFDSSFEFVSQREQSSFFYRANKTIDKDSLRVTWSEAHEDEEWICLQTFDQNGNGSKIRIVKVKNPAHRYMNFIDDRFHNRSFFYTLQVIDSPNVAIQGVILDANWQKVKDVSGTFSLITNLERAPLPAMDVAGNIHVFVYDKLSNYRLSAKLTINTLLFTENNFRSESFQFDHHKLYDPVFSDDPESRQWVMHDFFYEGQSKEKKGILTLKIPYERGKELITVFQDLPDSVQKELRKHTKNLRSRQPLPESLLTTGILENNASTVFITDLLDLPSHQLVRDVEVEPELRNQNRSKYRNSGPRYMSSLFSGNSGNTQNSGTFLNNGSAAINNTDPGSVGGPSGNRPSFFLTGSSNMGIEFLTPVNEKRVVFFIDARGDLQWYQYLPEENPGLYFSKEVPVSYLMQNGKERQFLHYHPTGFVVNTLGKADNELYNMQFSLTRISPTGISYTLTEAACPAGTKFFKPILLSDNKYLMPYVNVSLGKSGLALLQMGKAK